MPLVWPRSLSLPCCGQKHHWRCWIYIYIYIHALHNISILSFSFCNYTNYYNGIDCVLKAHCFQAKEEIWSLSEYQLLCVFISTVGNIITLALFAQKWQILILGINHIMLFHNGIIIFILIKNVKVKVILIPNFSKI